MTRRDVALVLILLLAAQVAGTCAAAWAMEAAMRRAQQQVFERIEQSIERVDAMRESFDALRKRTEGEMRRFGLPHLP